MVIHQQHNVRKCRARLHNSPVRQGNTTQRRQHTQVSVIVKEIIGQAHQPGAITMRTIQAQRLHVKRVQNSTNAIRVIRRDINHLLRHGRLSIFTTRRVRSLAHVNTPFMRVTHRRPHMTIVHISNFTKHHHSYNA